MDLHKWCANHPDLLEVENKFGSRPEYTFDEQSENGTIKTLGVRWNPQIDCFLFSMNFPVQDSYNKREVLSVISKIFDPLGIIGPVVTRAKIFMQRLWLSKLDWDDPLPMAMTKEWIDFVATLHELKKLKIPRYIFREDRIVLHGFSDASSTAYGAAIYIQSIPVKGLPTTQLLCSKSRVAPIKALSIPRLELSGCLLLAKLVNKVIPALNVKIESVNLWTDSTVALAWIKKSPHLLKTFVCNRVALIQQLTESYRWKHVLSEHNPADAISRGLDGKTIQECNIWWTGPDLLRDDLSHFEQPLDFIDDCEFTKELKCLPISSLSLTQNNSVLTFLLNLTNDYMKLIKIYSFIYRFFRNINAKEEKKSGVITLEERKGAELNLIREVQKGEFSSEIEALKRDNQVYRKSRLRTLNPFIDKNGIVRVGSRLAQAQVSYDFKYPIILPGKHKLTYMIMNYYHLKYLHLGPQGLLNTVRQKFWPINGRNLSRKVVHDCVQCFKHKPVPIDQLMGDLPAERVTVESTFNKCGLDFCGPFFIKGKNQRKGVLQKMYVAVFVCLVTRAIHLEIVSDLSSEALIATLKRFFARRGKSSTIFSDNASNFKGAKNELNRLFKLVKQPETNLTDYLLSEEIEWKFIPPRAPHFGGLWEAGVKSFKTHLKKTVGNSKLTIEEFLTLVTQIEGVLNSRPISPLSSDARDFNALTPGHFLIGHPITAPVEPEILNKADNRLSRWERVTKMTQNIWKRWHRDYLSQLHERTKWQFQKDNVKPGTVVLVKEDNLPVCQWVLGRVEEVMPGKDKRVRVVKLRTAKGCFKRPIAKLSILPIQDNHIL